MWFQLKHLQHKVCLFNLLLTDDLTFNIPLKKLCRTRPSTTGKQRITYFCHLRINNDIIQKF